ncbi:hypothetical protein CCYA_CCYA16G4071 [Cyanidiococcus yangmingshanensis]|nr:hypothetical protein CCYA_CCYA16G4071 [Cyanidiococcus yangmingshanensis]
MSPNRSRDDTKDVSADDSDEWELEAAALGVLRGRKISEFINDAAGLRQALKALETPAAAPSNNEQSRFAEQFRVTLSSVEQPNWSIDLNHDQDRETYFRAVAALGAWRGYEWCAVHAIPTERPEDYFAEMIKSDVHMTRVRQSLLQERQRLHEIQRLRSEALTRLEAKRRQREAAFRQQESKRTGLAQIEQWKQEQGLDRFDRNSREKRSQRTAHRRPLRSSKKTYRQKKNRPGKHRREQLRQARHARR